MVAMGVREVIDELNDVFRRQPVPHEEVLTVVGTAFESARTSGGREVVYFAPGERPAVRLTYTRKGEITAQAETGLDDELASLILARVRALIRADAPGMWRPVWFSSLPLTGYWRYRDEWQIVQVPEDAPKPQFMMGGHPFLMEVRGVRTGDSLVDFVRAERRLWELQLILSLVLAQVEISPNERSPTHAWVYVGGGSEPRSEFRQRGYVIPTPTAPEIDFTPVDGLDPIRTINDEDYFSEWNVTADFQLDVPAVLPTVFDRYAAADATVKDTFLRACYWLSRSRPAARLSMSMAYISVINSIEALMPDAERDPCPECGRDRAPGPTARFRELVERYAHGIEGVSQLYALRSKLVHGRRILDLDLPTAWGTLDPDELEQSHQHGRARRIATGVILDWFFDSTASVMTRH
jgi:hypothetical protein